VKAYFHENAALIPVIKETKILTGGSEQLE
jgi:hypothetical protein